MNILDNGGEQLIIAISIVVLTCFIMLTILLVIFTLILRKRFIKHFSSQERV